MTDYVKSTNFTSKDSLPSGNALKIVKGTEFDTEFNNIATAVATKADLASPALSGVPTAPTAALNTNTTQVATTAFVVSQIADDAPTKTGTGASGTWDINITGTVTNGVTTTGDQTIGGTKTFTNGIRFNDGTVQTTTAMPTASAGSRYVPVAGTIAPSNGDTLSTSDQRILDSRALVNGTVNLAIFFKNGNNGAEVSTIIYGRVYVNNVAVGTEQNTGTIATNTGATVTFTNISISKGDIVSIFAKASNTNFSFSGQSFRYGVSSDLNTLVLSSCISPFYYTL